MRRSRRVRAPCAAALSKALKVNVWVDTKPGASGVVDLAAVPKAAPDGNRLLYGFNQLVTFNLSEATPGLLD